MSDVSAVVLTIGESYTDRAIASVRRQSLPAADVVVVRGISPFHRALNSGAARVRTDFFIQVDADMILDDNCIEDLRSCMSDGVGTVVGHLRDPLAGRIMGIKLFRTECFHRVQLRDSISSETDFRDDLWRAGWPSIYALKYKRQSAEDLHTFGEHRPDYDPRYTFSKYLREGAKARYRRDGDGLRDLFQRLQSRNHSISAIARIAAAHGIFVTEKRDMHEPVARSEEFEFLERVLSVPSVATDVRGAQADLAPEDPRTRFKVFYALGIRLRRQPAAFNTHLRELQHETDLASWVALVSLCHGLFVKEYDDAEAEEGFGLLSDLLA
jgi:hypothetical protein